MLADGRELFADVSFRVGEGAKVALVGPNGAGKTTLLRMVAGDLPVVEGAVARSGGLGVMRQFIGMIADESTLNDLALSLATPAVRAAGDRLATVEQALHDDPSNQRLQLRYAEALTAWGEAGGYDAEVLFDTASTSALGLPWEAARTAAVRTLSGGQQKRFALELLLRGTDEVLLLDEPDNFLDVPAKRWLEARLRESDKSVLYVSHDRELLAQTATRVVTVEGGTAPGLIRADSPRGTRRRVARYERLDELRRRWDEEHQKLKDLVLMYKQKAAYNDGMASRYQAAQTRLRKFEEPGRRRNARRIRTSGYVSRAGRTGKRAVMCEQLELENLTFAVRPGDLVRRPGGRARRQRHGQVALPAVACPGRVRPGPRARPGGRCSTRRGPPRWQGAARRPGAAGALFADSRPSGPGREDPGRDPVARRRPPDRIASSRRHEGAFALRAGRPGRPAVRHVCPEGSRPDSWCCCSSCRVRRCCCLMNRRTTSTSRRPRHWRTVCGHSTVRSSRSPTTGGSLGRSTASCSSVAMARSWRLRNRSGTSGDSRGLDSAVPLV